MPALGALLVPAVLAFVAAPGNPGSQGSQGSPGTRAGDDPVEREWRARRMALAPDRDELARALASGDWQERHLALTALARTPAAARLAGGELGEVVRACCVDPHPNVRAAALAALGSALHLGVAGAGDPALDVGLARDPWPEVRVEFAAYLARVAEELGYPRATREGAAQALLTCALDATHPRAALRAARALAAGRGVFGRDLELWRASGFPLDQLPLAWHGVRDAREIAGLRAAADAGAGAPGVQARAHGIAFVELLALDGEWRGVPGVAAEDARLLAHFDDVAGWDGDDASRASLLRAAARRGDAGLARGWLDLAREHHAGGDAAGLARAWLAVECAAECLAPEDLDVRLAAELDPELCATLWRGVGARATGFVASRVAPWLSPEAGLDRELVFSVSQALASAWLEHGDPGAEESLLFLARVGDGRQRETAVRWLADGGRQDALAFERRMAALFEVWRGLERPERLRLLRHLPRDVALPAFRSGLLEELARDSREAGLAGLLANFVGDLQVAQALELALQRELDELDDPAAAGLARGWATALVAVLGEGAVPALGDAAFASLDSRLFPAAGVEPAHLELARTCVELLGASAPGRALLARGDWSDTPPRIEAEAQLALAREAPRAQAARTRLAELFEACRSDTALRILALFAASDEGASLAFLEAVAEDREADLERRLAAVEGLGSRAARASLARLLARDPRGVQGLEPRLAAARQLGALAAAGDLEARAELDRFLEPRLAGRLDSPEDERLLIDEALVARAGAGQLSVTLGRELTRAPLEAARADLERRFRGEHVPATDFRWRAELEACTAAARRGGLGPILDAAPGWIRADGRFLLALARRVAVLESGDGALALELALAAGAALAAEPPGASGDPEELVLDARLLVADLAARRGDWDALAWACGALDQALRLRTTPSSALERALGAFDPRAANDPRARLAAGREQALARAALARGDGTRARLRARRGALLALGDARALATQARLESELP